MKKTLTKGFTLIELLVVIAIIGILASVILASLNTARAKGADAASKEDLSNSVAQAALFYDAQTPNVYTGICTVGTAGGIAPMLTDAANKSGTTYTPNLASAQTTTTTNCNATATAWVASVPLKSPVTGGNYFCVDSAGNQKIEAAAAGAGATACI